MVRFIILAAAVAMALYLGIAIHPLGPSRESSAEVHWQPQSDRSAIRPKLGASGAAADALSQTSSSWTRSQVPPPVTERDRAVDATESERVPVEDLAYSFFSSTATVERLKSMISEEGVAHVEPALAELHRENADIRAVIPKLRRLCTQLRTASNGHEFAAVLSVSQREELMTNRRRALEILDKLSINDRTALEHYFDTKFRRGYKRVDIDYASMYAAAAFPSPETDSIIKRTCESASQAEDLVMRGD